LFKRLFCTLSERDVRRLAFLLVRRLRRNFATLRRHLATNCSGTGKPVN
jgi:hypothetical protein